MDSKKRIFVFSGKQGSGKSTYATALKEILGRDKCVLFKFAEVIYSLHDVCLPILKSYGIIPKDVTKEGQLLQVLGTEYGRKCLGENVWADALKRKVDAYLSEHSKRIAIIDDCRFENEFDTFHPVAYMIRLRADKEIRKARCSAWRENDTHISETGLDDYESSNNFDAIIDTDGLTEDTQPKKQLEYLLKEWGYLES